MIVKYKIFVKLKFQKLIFLILIEYNTTLLTKRLIKFESKLALFYLKHIDIYYVFFYNQILNL